MARLQADDIVHVSGRHAEAYCCLACLIVWVLEDCGAIVLLFLQRAYLRWTTLLSLRACPLPASLQKCGPPTNGHMTARTRTSLSPSSTCTGPPAQRCVLVTCHQGLQNVIRCLTSKGKAGCFIAGPACCACLAHLCRLLGAHHAGGAPSQRGSLRGGLGLTASDGEQLQEPDDKNGKQHPDAPLRTKRQAQPAVYSPPSVTASTLCSATCQ